ncbi:MAG: glutamine synthetase III [Christensenellaceae bacterium]|nr:glutamine synthetase III [Christensenellaceae bacterium]
MWESGKREPSSETLTGIADRFGLTVDYLLGREGRIAQLPDISAETPKSEIEAEFGSMVFSDSVMRERLPERTYRMLKESIDLGHDLTPAIADVIANAMKDWAIQKGATHFTHWFQPMTGITAEKHDCFLKPHGDKVIMEFSGKELIKGEPDASSFPSGGLRATFEARGYTAWDPTSYAFIKDGTLCIPTAFCSYSGEALDKKTPLLRSLEALDTEAVKLLSLFPGNRIKKVCASVGAEQEYFLIDRNVYYNRRDLLYTGRTLFGAMPPKGQELEDHYFGMIKPRVAAFMKDLDRELWKLGIPAKTEHNEVAPAQHELAPVFEEVNVATDHNQLTMEKLKTVAQRHDMACLLHEKPFRGINGSGKHNNWSLTADTGENLLKPGKEPAKNLRFLLILCAVIKAVDEYQDLLRMAAATAGNDNRLGAAEAPPAIISMYLGEELSDIIASIEKGEDYKGERERSLKTGVHSLPEIRKDSSDRNRTSPFAFTGNKFEFRMLGSSQSIAGANFILNTIVAEEFSQFYEELKGKKDFTKACEKLMSRVIKEHKRILFDGNNYTGEWEDEAERRGLLNLRTGADAIPTFRDEKNIDLFVKHGVFTRNEVISRTDIMLEDYAKILHIEANCMVRMARQDIMPAGFKYEELLTKCVEGKSRCSLPADTEIRILEKVDGLMAEISEGTALLDDAVETLSTLKVPIEQAEFCRDMIVPLMASLRKSVDSLEVICDKKVWPYPSTGALIFSVK